MSLDRRKRFTKFTQFIRKVENCEEEPHPIWELCEADRDYFYGGSPYIGPDSPVFNLRVGQVIEDYFSPEGESLQRDFCWASTSFGHAYWSDLRHGSRPVTEDDVEWLSAVHYFLWG